MPERASDPETSVLDCHRRTFPQRNFIVGSVYRRDGDYGSTAAGLTRGAERDRACSRGHVAIALRAAFLEPLFLILLIRAFICWSKTNLPTHNGAPVSIDCSPTRTVARRYPVLRLTLYLEAHS